MLMRWVEAQNLGRFEDYASFYAREFTGIRRSGKRTKQMDRDGWMIDRKRMFNKPMSVGIADLSIEGRGDTRTVVFTQTWATTSYKDVGRKRMVLRREGGAWRIAEEEMLTSQVEPPE